MRAEKSKVSKMRWWGRLWSKQVGFIAGLILGVVTIAGPLWAQSQDSSALTAELSSSTPNLSKSVLFYASREVLRDKIAKVFLYSLQGELQSKLQEALASMNDPQQPLSLEFSISEPVIADLIEKNREELILKLLPVVSDRLEAEQLLNKYQKLLSSWYLGAEGVLRIKPHFKWAKLDVDQPHEKNEELVAKMKKPEEASVISRVDFDLRAEPEIDFSGVKFFTKDGESGDKKYVPELNIDLSHVTLGTPSWFYIVSALEQVFNRKETQAMISEVSVRKDLSANEPRLDHLNSMEGMRSLMDGMSPKEVEDLVKEPASVLIYEKKDLSGNWKEVWVKKSSKAEENLKALRDHGQVGSVSEALVHFQEVEAPFHFREAWFGSNLGPNYLSIDSVDKVANQIFTEKTFLAVMKTISESETVQKTAAELKKDLDEVVVRELQKKPLALGALGLRMPDGQVKAHFFTDPEAYRRALQEAHDAENLVYAAKLKAPISVEELKVNWTDLLEFHGSLRLKSEIPVEAELEYVDPKKFRMETLGLKGSDHEALLKKMPTMNFTGSALKLRGRVLVPQKNLEMKLPFTWTERGPDIDEAGMKISLSGLEGLELKLEEFEWPGLPDGALRTENLPENVRCFLSHPENQACAEPIIGSLTQGINEIVQNRLKRWVGELTDTANAARFQEIETKTPSSRLKAKIELTSVDLESSYVRCDFKPLPKPAPQSALLHWECELQLPREIKGSIHGLEADGGKISRADAHFVRKSKDSVRFQLVMSFDAPSRSFHLYPEGLQTQKLLDDYEVKVEVPLAAEVEGKGFQAGLARFLKGTALSWGTFQGGVSQVAGLKVYSKIDSLERSSAAQSLVDGWNQSRSSLASELNEALQIKIPLKLLDRSVPLISAPDQVKGEAFTTQFLEVYAQKATKDLIHQIIHPPLENEAFDATLPLPILQERAHQRHLLGQQYLTLAPWKERLRRSLFELPFRYQKDIEGALFSTVQDEALASLTDQANSLFRTKLKSSVEGMASELLVKNKPVELPQVGSVCLVQNSTTQVKNIYSILIAAEKDKPAVLNLESETLPEDFEKTTHEGGFSLALGKEFLNAVLRENEETIRTALEETLKYDVNPDTDEKIKRSGISEERFKVAYVRAQFTRDELIIDTRIQQPFRAASKVVPGIGHVVDAVLSPALSVDTHNVCIRIRPDRESITIMESNSKESGGVLLQDQDGVGRRIELEKGRFRSLLTALAVKSLKKRLQEREVKIPLQTTYNNGLMAYQLQEMKIEPEWVVLKVEPKLDAKVAKPFGIQINLEGDQSQNDSNNLKVARESQ